MTVWPSRLQGTEAHATLGPTFTGPSLPWHAVSGPRLPVILLLIGGVGCFLGAVYFGLDAALTMAYHSNSEREFSQALQGAAPCVLGGILTGVTVVRWVPRGKP